MSLVQAEWETALLGDVCENLDKSRVPITKSKRVSGEIPYYGASGIVDYVEDYIFDEELLLVSEDGANLLARTYPIAFTITGKTWVNNHAHVLRFESEYSQKFIEYYLNSISLKPFVSGMAQPKLNQKSLNNIPVPLPPLSEKKRIVAILDEAFAGISQAVANAEKNLANARELFDSYLNNVFTQKGDGWVELPLGDVCVLQRGFDLPKRLRVAGNFPLVSSSGVIDSHVKAKVFGPGVATGRSGSIGSVFFIKEDFWPLNTVLYVKEFFNNDPEFIYHLLNKFDLKKYASGAGVPTLNRNNVHSEFVSIPGNVEEQRQIVMRLNHLRAETQKLEEIYQQKLSALAELKQSILQKAFAGELR